MMPESNAGRVAPITPEERARIWQEKSGDCEFCPCCWEEMRRYEAALVAAEQARDQARAVEEGA